MFAITLKCCFYINIFHRQCICTAVGINDFPYSSLYSQVYSNNCIQGLAHQINIISCKNNITQMFALKFAVPTILYSNWSSVQMLITQSDINSTQQCGLLHSLNWRTKMNVWIYNEEKKRIQMQNSKGQPKSNVLAMFSSTGYSSSRKIIKIWSFHPESDQVI